jgi:hypothetical protein
MTRAIWGVHGVAPAAAELDTALIYPAHAR